MLEFPDKFEIDTCSINAGSYISAHFLLNLLNELASLAFYHFFATSLINSLIQEHK